jgi:hypothetical protein
MRGRFVCGSRWSAIHRLARSGNPKTVLRRKNLQKFAVTTCLPLVGGGGLENRFAVWGEKLSACDRRKELSACDRREGLSACDRREELSARDGRERPRTKEGSQNLPMRRKNQPDTSDVHSLPLVGIDALQNVSVASKPKVERSPAKQTLTSHSSGSFFDENMLVRGQGGVRPLDFNEKEFKL